MDKVILELCDKFGVTVDKLMPQVITHGQYSSKIELIISSICLLIIVVAISALLFVHKGADRYSTLETACECLIIVLGICLVIAIIVTIYNAYSYYMWIHSPRIMAIKFILNSVGGN